jgi:hypothetical protein
VLVRACIERHLSNIYVTIGASGRLARAAATACAVLPQLA